MSWLGLDIGGANLKVADGLGFALTREFPLWKARDALAQELRSLLSQAPAHDHLLATMTGELADCFTDKLHGVHFILQQLEAASDGRHTRVYAVDGRMLSVPAARREFALVASANWHALARFACRFVPEGAAGLLVDIGSTTTDLIPLTSDLHEGHAWTDLQRLLAGQLIYTGVARSPICAVLRRATYRGQSCPVAQELFATAKDAYLLLGWRAEDPTDRHTADGEPSTRVAARRRLGRMVCADSREFHHRDAVLLAQEFWEAQQELILTALRQLYRMDPAPSTAGAAPSMGPYPPPEVVVLSGAGEFLARQVIERWSAEMECTPRVISLSDQLGPAVSLAANAHALAVLAREVFSPPQSHAARVPSR